MRFRFLAAAVLTIAVAACASAARQPEPPRLVVLSWDGAADSVVDRLLDEGRLPNLARLAARGMRATSVRPAVPSMTAASFATLWTGAWGDVNGVTGNTVPLLPRSEHTILETRSGFDSASLLAEPLWMPAARAGRRVTILSATQSNPPERYVEALEAEGVPADRLAAFDGFQSTLAGGAVIGASSLRPAAGWPDDSGAAPGAREFEAGVAGDTFYGLVYDDPADPVVGLDTVRIRQGSRAEGLWADLKPAEAVADVTHWSPGFRVARGSRVGFTAFRLFALSPDGGEMVLYQRGVSALGGTGSPAEREAVLAAAGGFHDLPFDAYERGAFGPTLWQAGEGTAEARLLEIVRLDATFTTRGTLAALDRDAPDLLFDYTAAIDGAGHTWMGVLDPASPAYDRAVADAIWPFYVEVYELQDDWLGQVMDHVEDATLIAVVSDHGMAGVGRLLAPNVVLEQAGLLFRDDDAIDLSRTRVLAPPWGAQLIAVNGTDWKDGIVSPAEREEALEAATQAFLAVRDPSTGRAVVTRMLGPGDIPGAGGPAGGDLYFDLAPGYGLTSSMTGPVLRSVPTIGGGSHGFTPTRADMQAIWFLAGPGVPAGTTLGPVEGVDVAPTLAALLGIPAPRDARGQGLIGR